MDDFIVEFPNAIPPELCQSMINRFENDNRKQPGVIGIGDRVVYLESMKKTIEIPISMYRGWEDISQLMKKYIFEYTERYLLYLKSKFDKNTDLHTLEPYIGIKTIDISNFNMHKIENGGHDAWHNDGDIYNPNSFCQFIIYLNDLVETDGGYTEFINGKKIFPRKGKILFFPKSWTFPHRGYKVCGKPKYTVCGYIYLIPKS